MSDWYLLLTPILMLAVVGLVGFVGCGSLLDLEEVPPVLPAPTNFIAVPGNAKIDLSWDMYANVTSYTLDRRLEGEAFEQLANPLSTETSYPDLNLTNGLRYYYSLRANVGNQVTPAALADATVGLGVLVPFVTGQQPGTRRSDFTGWVGMAIHVGASPLRVKTLGRWRLPPDPAIPGDQGNTRAHDLKIFDVAANADLLNGGTSVAFNAGDPPAFKYAPLPDTVTLDADGDYYIISREVSGEDQFYDSPNTSITVEPVVTTVFAVNGDGLMTYNVGAMDRFIYGPVSFEYEPL